MKNYLLGAGVIFSLEMRQRIRGAAWWVLLGVFFAIILIVTVLLSFAFSAFRDSAGSNDDTGRIVFSAIIYFVLLLGTLVAPAMSGNAINGDRDAGTLATTQVTLVSTGQIILGKFLAAWVTALGFLAASVPFLVYATLAGGLTAPVIIVPILVLALELGIVAAIGVGLSGIITRPLFSIVVTYLVVAALSVGTLIAFSLGGLVVQSPTTIKIYSSEQTDNNDNSINCTYDSTFHSNTPRYDYVWGILAANPYVLLADAIPTTYDRNGQPRDLFGAIKVGERSLQIPPKLNQVENDCDLSDPDSSQTAQQTIDSTTPSWAVGLGVQVVLAALGLWGAWRALRTPAGRLSKGSRIA